ncbi:MAG: hypothetical protein DWI58_18965 [Chloroflexi bacterium]|nr:MAG: hypothetical protein DWI58_18965 [Chloroflexota bacterium]
MHRGSLVAGVLSLLGAAGAAAVVITSGNVGSMYSLIVIVLLVNAAVRFRLARDESHDRRR